MVHEIDEDVWTPKKVELALLEAIRWAQTSGPGVGPAGDRSGWPGLLMTSDDRELAGWPAIYELEPQPMRRGYSPAKVSQMERVLGWPMKYLSKFEKDNEFTYSVFKAWVHTKIHKGPKFDKTCKELGWSRATAYRCKDRVLGTIAVGLTNDGIKWGQH